jgi:hypothetical protein
MKRFPAVEDAIRRKLAPSTNPRPDYDQTRVIETDRWWFIPWGWIGCAGFIVNKEDLYVNWLGSALTLENCFWGHDHGIYHDLIDFSFSAETDRLVAARLIPRFKHMLPNAKGVLPNEPVWYRDSEIQPAIDRQFPFFKRHFIWYGIPELRRAYENNEVRFTCALSQNP